MYFPLFQLSCYVLSFSCFTLFGSPYDALSEVRPAYGMIAVDNFIARWSAPCTDGGAIIFEALMLQLVELENHKF